MQIKTVCLIFCAICLTAANLAGARQEATKPNQPTEPPSKTLAKDPRLTTLEPKVSEMVLKEADDAKPYCDENAALGGFYECDCFAPEGLRSTPQDRNRCRNGRIGDACGQRGVQDTLWRHAWRQGFQHSDRPMCFPVKNRSVGKKDSVGDARRHRKPLYVRRSAAGGAVQEKAPREHDVHSEPLS